MKYELIKTDISPERTIMRDIIEVIDGIETITGQEETDDYEVIITLSIHPIDDIVPYFLNEVIIRNNNSQTGFQVDIERAQAIETYMQSINSVI